MLKKYRTILEQAEAEIVEKKSRFIATVRPVKTEDEARAFIEEMKKKYWNATHNVFAYQIGERNELQRFSDDGEPQGTAGMPVLNVILQEGITDCVVVVTRYFGGILLGGGGLVRAYTHSAKIGIDAAEIITLLKWSVCKISCDYTFYGKLETFIRDFGGVIENTDFGENVILTEGLVLQQKNVWEDGIKREVSFGGHDAELYFEESDMDGFLVKLKESEQKVEFVDEQIPDHAWGGRVVRIYDPDKHVIEVGEVVQR